MCLLRCVFFLISLPSELFNRIWMLCCYSTTIITPKHGERRAQCTQLRAVMPPLLLDVTPAAGCCGGRLAPAAGQLFLSARHLPLGKPWPHQRRVLSHVPRAAAGLVAAQPLRGPRARLSRPGPGSRQPPPGRPRAPPRDAAAGGPWRRLPVTARGGARSCAPAASGCASGSAGGPSAAWPRPRPWADSSRRPPAPAALLLAPRPWTPLPIPTCPTTGEETAFRSASCTSEVPPRAPARRYSAPAGLRPPPLPRTQARRPGAEQARAGRLRGAARPAPPARPSPCRGARSLLCLPRGTARRRLREGGAGAAGGRRGPGARAEESGGERSPLRRGLRGGRWKTRQRCQKKPLLSLPFASYPQLRAERPL